MTLTDFSQCKTDFAGNVSLTIHGIGELFYSPWCWHWHGHQGNTWSRLCVQILSPFLNLEKFGLRFYMQVLIQAFISLDQGPIWVFLYIYLHALVDSA